MAHFLFSANASVDKGKRKDDYPPLLADIVRGATDSIHALNLFRELVVEHRNGLNTPGFLAFDAHVGETGCHLRAGMVNDIFSTYRHLYQSNPSAWRTVEIWLDETIANLARVVTQARTTCASLSKDKVKPTQLGLNSKQETPRKILLLLGWPQPEQSLRFSTAHAKRVDAFESSASGSSSSSLQDEKGRGPYHDRAVWDVLDSAILARFVIYAYILSKYKAFSFYNGSPNGSLQPQAADDFTHKLMEGSWKLDGKRPGLRRLDNEFRDLQIWLSDLSCAWLQSLADRSDMRCDMSSAYSLISSTIQRSRLGQSAVACYPGYLLEREFLWHQSTPIVLVDRHFCSQGYHINIFEASIAPPAESRSSGALATWIRDLFRCILPTQRRQEPAASEEHQSALCPPLRWRLKQTSIDQLMAEGNPTTPHMVVTGNSLRGSHEQYTELVKTSLRAAGDRPANSLPHVDDVGSSMKTGRKKERTSCLCAENEAHVTEFLRADHDRIALSFFAVHCAYSFPLTSGEDEVSFVENAMDAWAGAKEQMRMGVESPAAMWRASREEADSLGTGAGSMHLFRWQHAFAESRGRLGWLLQRSMEEAALMPLKAVLPEDET